jgi:hypothetical protein
MKNSKQGKRGPRVVRETSVEAELHRLRCERAAAGLPVPERADDLIRVRTDVNRVHRVAEAAVTDAVDEHGRPVVEVRRPDILSAMPDWHTALAAKHDAVRELLEVFQAAAVNLEDVARRAAEPWRDAAWRPDPFTERLLGLLGPEAAAVTRRGLPAAVLVGHAGLFLDGPTPEGLALLVRDAFGVPARAERRRGRLRLHVGPVCWERFTELRPPRGRLWQPLVWLAALYVGDAAVFDIRLLLAAAVVPDCVPDGEPAVPDWGCWLKDKGEPSPRDGALLLDASYCRRCARGEDGHVAVT